MIHQGFIGHNLLMGLKYQILSYKVSFMKKMFFEVKVQNNSNNNKMLALILKKEKS
jgi:hypothetical protein